MTFEKEDFDVKIIQRRVYGRQTLCYANVVNKKTNTSIQDWIRPDQARNPQTLPIKW